MLSIWLVLFGCFNSEKKIVCSPKHLAEMSDCQGEDHSLKECRYYYRAIGKPDIQWCSRLKEGASQQNQMQTCDFNKVESWISLPCATYGFDSKMNCYGCVLKEPEASKTYLFAYNQECTQAIEQETCNISPISVLKDSP